MTIYDDAQAAARAVVEDALSQRDSQITTLTEQKTQLQTQVNMLNARVSDLQVRLDEANEEIDRLNDLLDNQAPEPEPARNTQFGADAYGTSANAQNDVLAKYGNGSSIRQFFTGFTQVAPRNANASIVHASWKPSSVSAITESAVRNACANLKPGDCVEVWHEIDKKVRDGVFSRTEGIARKNKFYDVVKAVRPDLLVVNTLTGWELDPNNSNTRGNIDNWADVKADLLGVDCDGVHGWPYPNYDGEIATATKFVEKFTSYKGWSVPEFGTSRNSANDSSGGVRAQWATSYANKFKAAGAVYVCLYTYESTPGNNFTTASEVNAWKSMVETNDD